MSTQLRPSEAMRRTGDATWLAREDAVALEELLAVPGGPVAPAATDAVGLRVTVLSSGRF